MTKNQEAADKVGAAKFALTYARHYLGSAVWNLIPIETEGIGTLGVDEYFRLYYDPATVMEWDIETLISVLYHETFHVMRDHAARGKGHTGDPQDKMRWNMAADAEINDDIRAEHSELSKLTPGAIYPERFNEPEGLMAEEYYASQGMEDAMQPQQGQQGQGDGEPQQGQAGPGEGNCGSAAHGQQESHEHGKPSDNDDDGKGGLGKSEAELVRKQVAREIKEAAASRGSVPSGWERWATDQLTEKVDWRKQLMGIVRRAVAYKRGPTDYTYARPSRRDTGSFILPTMQRPVPEIAAVIDTSGSMSDRQVSQCVAEIAGILKSGIGDSGLTVLAVDADVAAVSKVFRKDAVKLGGGGGTDMRVGIKAAEDLRPRPDIVIVLTDGETPWPDAPPRGGKLIVALLPNGNQDYYRERIPSWAAVVSIDWQ